MTTPQPTNQPNQPNQPNQGATKGTSKVVAIRPLASTRSCMELGLCQRRAPACAGCDHQNGFWNFTQQLMAGGQRTGLRPIAIDVDGPHRPLTRWYRARVWLRRRWLVVLLASGYAVIVAFAIAVLIGILEGWK